MNFGKFRWTYMQADQMLNHRESLKTKLPDLGRKNMQCCMTAYGHKKACNSAGLRPVIKLVIIMRGCRARLPGKTVVQDCRARLPGKAAGQGCRPRLQDKAAGQGCRARLLGIGAIC
jgi:hypothetical protein